MKTWTLAVAVLLMGAPAMAAGKKGKKEKACKTESCCKKGSEDKEACKKACDEKSSKDAKPGS